MLNITKMVEFDDRYVYITKGKTVTILPLAAVCSIQATGRSISCQKMWNVEYIEDNKLKKVSFLPKINPFKKFKDKVRSNNPQANVENAPMFDVI